MAANSFTEWQALTPLGQQTGGVPGSASNTFPMHAGPEPWFRDKLDAARSGRIPSAEYPDGYLSTVRTRRQDRLVQHGGERQTQKSYERGVHVGARVSPESYFWTNEVNPKMGLELQAAGMKFAPQGEAHTHLINGGKPGPRGSQSLDDERLRPRARSG